MSKAQSGGALGALLASIDIPLAIEAKKLTGKGAPRIGKGAPRMGKPKSGRGGPNLGVYQPPPPFVGTWEQAMGNKLRFGAKKKLLKGKGCC